MIDAFPYPPYDIQKQLMVNVYEALRQRRIGLFESPTGTGKTLSLICSTLKWLEDERRIQEEAATTAADEDNALPDWMRNHSQTPAEPLQRTQIRAHQKLRVSQQAKVSAVLDAQGNDISEFLVTGEATAADAPGSGSKRTAAAAGYLSSSSDEQEADITIDPAAQQRAEPRSPQLIFCSRTHSQLSQFVGELHRTKYADSVMLLPLGSRKALCVNDEVLKLQNLSQINERCLDLQRNKSSKSRQTAAAEAPNSTGQQVVSFMQQSSKRRQRKQAGSGGSCPYLSAAGAAAWEGFSDLVIAAPIDVEELAKLGKKKQLCPYYGSRRAVPLVDVILAPYSTILMPDARDSMGIQLRDAVLVFDEAHNLLDAINGAHSTAVTAWQLLSVQRSLTAYYERFKSFLNPANAQNIQVMLRIAAALHKCLNQSPQHQHLPHSSSSHGSNSTAAAGRVVTVNDLLFELGIDNINILELAGWVKDNKMAFKVSGYTAAATAGAEGAVDLQHKVVQGSQQRQRPVTGSSGTSGPTQAVSGTAPTSSHHQADMGQLSGRDGVSAIHSFVSFLLSLTNSNQDGRVIIQPVTAAEDSPAAVAGGGAAAEQGASGRGSHMRYILLNAARHFGRVLASARSVVLISGTLAPIDGLKAQLFPDIPPERLLNFECGHVVPADQLLAVSIGRGPSGRTLNLRHENRNDAAVIDELGHLLLNIAGVVPEGLVVFAPSFGYLEQLVSRWSCSGVLGRLQQRKQVFREPRSATEVEQVLTAYAAAVTVKDNSNSHSSYSSSTAHCCDQPPAAAGSASVTAAVNTGKQSSGSTGGTTSSVSGAVMLCVVGGKLSEGINFGDGLGRCVVILGMPYPNSSDPELKERMNYLDRQAAAAAAAAAVLATNEQLSLPVNTRQQQTADPAELNNQQHQQQRQHNAATLEAPRPRTVFQAINGSSRQSRAVTPQLPAKEGSQQLHQDDSRQASGYLARTLASAASGSHCCSMPENGSAGSSSSSSPRLITGREYYDDLCFKAVNQCVGRVVRHRGDYAAIVLVDSRWVVPSTDWAAINAAEQPSRGTAAAVTQHERQQQQTFQGTGGEGNSSVRSSGGSGRRLPVQKLPGWVQKSYVATSGDFGQAQKQLAGFFTRQQARHQQQQQ